jgi:hypothetical protein
VSVALSLLVLLASGPLGAADQRYLKGYARDVAGETIGYHSHHPYATMALLTRATTGEMAITWETEPIPPSHTAEFAEFLWFAGYSCGTSSADTRFDVLLNGKPALHFTTLLKNPVKTWSVKGSGGSELRFDWVWTDQVEDLFGRMVLKVPAAAYPKGEPLRVSIVGEKGNRRDWYMTFKYAPIESVMIRPQPALLRLEKGTGQLIDVLIDHVDERGKAVVAGEGRTLSFPLVNGLNRLEFPVTPATAPRDIEVSVSVDGALLKRERMTLRPVAHRDLYLIPHSHNDIGYSDLQTDVEAKQLKNIRDALGLIRATAGYPEGARFKWNIEILWPVETFLQSAPPAEREEFLAAVRGRSIGLHAMYSGQITGICRPEELMRLTDYARSLTRDHGIPVRTAMISDIPGSVWSVVPAFAHAGVRYFTSGPNYNPSLADGGDRVGHFNRSWGDRPFYWVSPSGREKLLMWVAGRGYSWFHGWVIGKAGEGTTQHTFEYLNALDDGGYPYDMVQLRYTIVSDNGPTDPGLSDFVRSWNARYVSPRYVIATADEMFERFEAQHGKHLPAYAGDITPYWEDGALSSMAELATVRRASESLLQSEALGAIIAPEKYTPPRVYQAWRSVHLFDEHTWGAHNSVSEPDTPFAVAQWDMKRSFALAADSLARALRKELVPAAPASAFDVVNTSSWARSDVVVLPAGVRGSRVVDDAGKLVPSQRLSTGELAFLSGDLPPLGARRYALSHGDPPGEGSARASGRELRNDLLDVSIHPLSGAVASLRVRGRQENLVRFPDSLGLNAYLYVPGLDPSAVQRVEGVTIAVKERGPLVASILVESKAPGARALRREYRLVHGLNRLEIITTIDKEKVRQKESVHIAFPLNVPEGVLRTDNGWGIVRPEADQLAGSCRDFLYAQRWADLSNQSFGVTWTVNESPLVEVGDLTDERVTSRGTRAWKTATSPSTVFYSYVMNNYWHTNYKADQSGPVALHYAIHPHEAFNATEAHRRGEEQNAPLIVLPAASGSPPAQSLFTVDPPAVVVSSLKPSDDGKALMVRLYNAGGRPEAVSIGWNAFRPSRVAESSVAEERGITVGTSLSIPAFGIVTLRCER